MSRMQTTAACGLIALLVAGVATASTPASATAGGHTYLLKAGDYFTVSGTHILCAIRKANGSNSSELITCFLFKSPRSVNPILGSYEFSIGQIGLIVERADRQAPKLLFTVHYPASYHGVYAGNTPAPGAHKANLRSDDGVLVVHSDVGCIALAPKRRGDLVVQARALELLEGRSA